MTRRVCIGQRSAGVFGLFIARAGYDAITDDANDRTKFSFSSTWGEQLGFVLAGQVATGTWVSLPSAAGFWPAIYWDIETATATYKSNEILSVTKSTGSYWLALTPINLAFQTVSGVRQFSFSSSVGSRTIRYAVTGLKVAS